MSPRASRFRLALLTASLVLCPTLSGCELLTAFLCDPESDPSCEDPERGQILGRIRVPEGAASAGATIAASTAASARLAPAIEAMRQALLSAPSAERPRAERPRSLPARKYRPPRAGTAPERGWKAASAERWREGEVIVRGEVPVRRDRDGFATALEAALGDGTRVAIGLCNSDHVCLAHLKDAQGELLSELAVADAARRLRRAPGVRFAEVNRVLQALRTPNDPLYPLQWHYGAMRLPTAWDITTGSEDVVAAVIDTGILGRHPDLDAQVVGGADLISDLDVANDGDGRDDDGDDPGDEACGGACHSYHGTHVAGTMAARTDNARMVAGVAWRGQLLAVRVLGKGGGSLFDIAGGILWSVGEDVDGVARNPRPADVLNLSLGGRGESEVMNDAIRYAVDQGAIVVVAAGNDNADASEYTPANAPDAITVAAVGNVGGDRLRPRRTSYSNFGVVVDVAAPGGEQQEDIDDDGHPDGVLSTLSEDVEFYQGTSMAAPHVAGLAMLMKSLDPSLGQNEARALITRTANRDIDCQGCGAGLANAAQALRAMRGEEDEPLVVPVPDVVRVGRGDLDAELAFANEGGATTSVTLTIEGRDRSRVTLDAMSATLAPGEALEVRITLDRTGEDAGEAVVSAAWGDGEVAEARLFWTDDFIRAARTVSVGALRVDGEDYFPERIVTASATDGYAYKLFNLPPGSYLVIGLSDDDNDGEFEPAEGVGVYPRIQERALVTASAGQRAEGIDFLVAPSFVYNEDAAGSGDRAVGAACQASGDCLGELYCEGLFPGGYCTQDCSSRDCPQGSECFCLEGDSGACDYQICLALCSADADCRTGEGYVCDVDQTCYPE